MAAKRAEANTTLALLELNLEQEANATLFKAWNWTIPPRPPGSREPPHKLPADRDVLVHCKTDIRSAAAARDLAAAGLTRLYVLEGGIDAWAREVDPSLPAY